MKISDIIRDIANLLDKQGNSDANTHLQPVALPKAKPSDETDEPIMVPPLQQKHELLKKVAGVDNVYDQEDEQPTELTRMKKMAGIITSDDNEGT